MFKINFEFLHAYVTGRESKFVNNTQKASYKSQLIK